MGVGVAVASLAMSAYSAHDNKKRADEAKGDNDARYQESLNRQRGIDKYNKEAYDTHIAEYERMRNIYGPLQEDIGTYYRNLTGASLSNDRVAKIQKAYQKSQDDVRKKLAQSGRSTSGVQDELLAGISFNNEMGKATARMTAETDAIKMKEGYVNSQVALSQNEMNMATGAINGMQVGVNNANNLASAQSSRGSAYADYQNKTNSQFYSDLQDTLGWGARQYEEYSNNQARGGVVNTDSSDYLGMF